MSDLAHIQILGRLTREAELRDAGDTKVCAFGVAVKQYGEEEPTFYNVSLFGKRGEAMAEHLGKGQQVVVVGNLKIRKYEYQGEHRTSYEIRASDVEFAGSKPEGAGSDSEPVDDWD